MWGGEHGVLMKGDVGCGHLWPDVRHGIAGNFWADERLNQIDEVRVAQKVKGAAAAGFPYVGTAIDLVALL